MNALPVKIKNVWVRQGPNKTVVYPQVILKNEPLARFINQMISYETHQLIHMQVNGMPSTVEEMIGTYEIKNNQRNVFSLTLSNYTYHTRAAHGMKFIRSLSFDLEKGSLLTLKDLFKSGSNYVGRLSTLIQKQMKTRNIPLIHEFTTIQPNQGYYLADKTIVIYFQLYEITPYVFGFPMFPISLYDLEDIMNENGPLPRLSANN